MSDEFRNLYAIKDKKSGKYLNNIWLANNPDDISLFMTIEEVQHHISRIRMGRFVPNGGTGFSVEDLVVVKLEVNSMEEIN